MFEFFDMITTPKGFLFVVLIMILVGLTTYITFRAFFAAYYRSRSDYVERLHRIYLQLTGRQHTPSSPPVKVTNNQNGEDN